MRLRYRHSIIAAVILLCEPVGVRRRKGPPAARRSSLAEVWKYT
jgi:hypothetical protein